MLESGISTATSTAFTATYNAVTLTENIEYYASAVYAGVDQILPYTSTQVFTTTATGATVTVSPTLATTGGGMAVAAIHCGNNTTPASAIGGTNTFSVTSTFTETIDTYTANPSFGTSGMCTQIAHQAIASSGTVAPSYTFAGTPNRRVVIYVNLACVAELDNSVRLVKGGTITGSNFAYTTSPWNTVDTYTSYGGPTSLWGTTWSVAEVNALNFGAVISASVNNGTARVDHMRISIYGTSTLPIELIDFIVKPEKDYRKLIWRTASEKNNKEFIVERRSATTDFESIGTVKGNENTTTLSEYTFIDEENLLNEIYYYRLKQIDFDNTFEYSLIVSCSQSASELEPIIYPNPSTSGLFNIEIGSANKDEIQIYSSELKLIKKIIANESKLNLSLQELADGTYFLIFNLPDGQKIKQIQKICR